MEETKEKLNSMSFRYGGTGTYMKIYFKDAEDLDTQMAELVNKAPTIKANMEHIKSTLGGDSK